MKKILFFILFITTAHLTRAQVTSWTVRLGDKVIASFEGEDKEKNVVKLTIEQILKKKRFSVGYITPRDEKEWIRTFMINDSTGSGISIPKTSPAKWRGKDVRFTTQSNDLAAALSQHKKIMIYFTSIPSDPAKAALVRVRPVHICTIILEE
jgi:hypothetical protein